jgi:cytochrome c-type biogenesis protein CcmH/NrfF
MRLALLTADVLPSPAKSSSPVLWIGLVALLVSGLVAIWILRRRTQRDERDERK